WTMTNPADFANVFADGASLDLVPIFNLLATPGFSSNAVASEAVAYCERKRAFYIMDTPSSSSTTTVPSSISWDVDDLSQNVSTDLQTYGVPVSINAGL